MSRLGKQSLLEQRLAWKCGQALIDAPRTRWVSREVVLRQVELGKVFLDQVVPGKIYLRHVKHGGMALLQVELDKTFLRRTVSHQMQRQLSPLFPGFVDREQVGDQANAVGKAPLSFDEVMAA